VTLGSLITMTRHFIQEKVEAEFLDTYLTSVLNSAAGVMLGMIVEVNKSAHVATYTTDLVAAQSLYALPAATFRLWMVQRWSTALGKYVKLKKLDYVHAEDDLDGSPSEPAYALVGTRHVAIYPQPTANQTPGLRFFVTHQAAMAESTDVPDIHFALHPGIALLAKMMILEETGEVSNETMARFQVLFQSRIPALYGDLSNDPEMMSVAGLDKTGY